MENWSGIEVIWTLLAATGAYFSFRNIRDGIKDLTVLKSLRNGNSLENKILKITAWGNTRRDSIREFIQVMFIIIGIWAGLVPNNPNPSLLGLIFQGILITVSLGLTVSAIGDQYDRRRLHALGMLIQAREDELSTSNGS